MINDQPLTAVEPQVAEASDTNDSNSTVGSAWILRRRDQAVIIALLFAAFLALAAWYISNTFSTSPNIRLDAAEHQAAHFAVDINTAPWPEIAQLPGVGETLARRVVESREQDGLFHSIAELRRVRGVGKVTLERITPFLRPLQEVGEKPANAATGD